METEKATLNEYRVKKEFQKLFENLASGETFTANEAFKDQSLPHRKSIASAEEALKAQEREATIEKLVADGFVERISTDFEVRSKG